MTKQEHNDFLNSLNGFVRNGNLKKEEIFLFVKWLQKRGLKLK